MSALKKPKQPSEIMSRTRRVSLLECSCVGLKNMFWEGTIQHSTMTKG